MKTPRDILLAKHQATAPKLDVIRHQIVATQFHRRSFAVIVLYLPSLFWRELVLPSRRVWTGLATIWILILVVNFFLRDHSQKAMARVAPYPNMVLALRQQQQLMSELFNPSDVPVAEPKKPYAPQPGSERRLETTTA
jgi:hypothetical protein